MGDPVDDMGMPVGGGGNGNGNGNGNGDDKKKKPDWRSRVYVIFGRAFTIVQLVVLLAVLAIVVYGIIYMRRQNALRGGRGLAYAGGFGGSGYPSESPAELV